MPISLPVTHFELPLCEICYINKAALLNKGYRYPLLSIFVSPSHLKMKIFAQLCILIFFFSKRQSLTKPIIITLSSLFCHFWALTESNSWLKRKYT